MLNGDLCSDIVGTNPVQPPIIDHSWLDVDLAKYDNYPSDNNPVRVIPKLNDLWENNGAQTGANLVPNCQVQPLGVRSSNGTKEAHQVVKEAKKAIMSGLKGKALSQHLRARFASKHIKMAQDELKKIAEEVGLLGNVYIDASAFDSYQEAEQFLNQHRNRLARDILMETDGIHINTISLLASTFHKNVVSSINYDETLLEKYRNHLVQAKRIPADTIIASKEDLRDAFLYVAKKAAPVVAEPKSEKKMAEEQKQEIMSKLSEEKALKAAEEKDMLLLPKIYPIAAFVQESLSKGKKASAVKELVKAKFAMADIQVASEALGVVLSKAGLSEENISKLIKAGEITLTLGEKLKEIGQKYVAKEVQTFDGGNVTEKSVGVQGYEYSLSGKKSSKNETYRNAAVEAIQKGIDLERVKGKLLQKFSTEDTDQILTEALIVVNSSTAQANKVVKPKKAVVESPTEKVTLPDPSTIPDQIKEVLSTFENLNTDIDINPSVECAPVSVEGLYNQDADMGLK